MEWEALASPDPSMDSVNVSPHRSDRQQQSFTYSPSEPQVVRRRVGVDRSNETNGSHSYEDKTGSKSGRFSRQVVKNFDMFPKVESDMTVRTDRGGIVTLSAYFLTVVLILAEWWSWSAGNSSTVESVLVDTSLNRTMRVYINITFPALHCDDLHVDLMDVAGDVQLDVVDTMIKRRLHLDGSLLDAAEIAVERNQAHADEEKKQAAIKKTLQADYCGPCYGAQQEEGQCCGSCDDVVDAYKKKRWNFENVRRIAEQCIREGKTEPKAMSKGEGCNLSGHMSFNRVAGNFHIAMGEGVERNGRHIHTFLPDDSINFNASHIIHELSFGPNYKDNGSKDKREQKLKRLQINSLDGVRKIVKEEDGSTGLFQYFIKIVPTAYKGENYVKSLLKTQGIKAAVGADVSTLETNRYFFTERFRPLMTELEDEHWGLGGLSGYDKDKKMAGVKAGGNVGTAHAHSDHHKVQNSVLPGVFFIYEVYPFAVEVTKNSVPFTHLLIRIMATVGGVFTIVGWIDSVLYASEKKAGRR